MWKVEYKKRFLKELSKLPEGVQAQAENVVFESLICENPFDLGCLEQMRGSGQIGMTRRVFQNETPPTFQRLLQYVGKDTLFHNRNHLPSPFGKGTVRAFIRVSPPGILFPLWEARLVSTDCYALC